MRKEHGIVPVFLNVRTVAYRGPTNLRTDLLIRYKAEWHTRGTTSEVIYVSKVSTDRVEVIKLARKWLKRINKPALMLGGHDRTIYIDTTEQPERFGYSHPVKSFYPEPK